MTVGEVSTELRLSPRTIRNQIANGRLQATKRGRDWDIPEEEVDRYRVNSRGRPGRPASQPTLGLFD